MAVNPKSLAVWEHNRLRGNVEMAKTQMNNIVRAATVTPAARALAAEIHSKLLLLAVEMMERQDGKS